MALTPAQHVAAAVDAVLAIPDLAQRTLALTDLAETLADAQARARQGRTEALLARVARGETRAALATELGLTPARITQLLAGNKPTAPLVTAGGDAHVHDGSTPEERLAQRLAARKNRRARIAARRHEVATSAKAAHPDATNAQLASILNATLDEGTRQELVRGEAASGTSSTVTRQHVTAWLAPPTTPEAP